MICKFDKRGEGAVQSLAQQSDRSRCSMASLTAMHDRVRQLLRVAVVLVVAHLMTDLTGPLVGAFRLDPSTAAQASAWIASPDAPTPASQPARVPRPAPTLTVQPTPRPPAFCVVVRPICPRIVYRSESPASPAANDD